MRRAQCSGGHESTAVHGLCQGVDQHLRRKGGKRQWGGGRHRGVVWGGGRRRRGGGGGGGGGGGVDLFFLFFLVVERRGGRLLPRGPRGRFHVRMGGRLDGHRTTRGRAKGGGGRHTGRTSVTTDLLRLLATRELEEVAGYRGGGVFFLLWWWWWCGGGPGSSHPPPPLHLSSPPPPPALVVSYEGEKGPTEGGRIRHLMRPDDGEPLRVALVGNILRFLLLLHSYECLVSSSQFIQVVVDGVSVERQKGPQRGSR